MKKQIRSMVYRNKNPEGLQGQRALVRVDPNNDNNFLCQFDKLDLEINGVNLAHGWHSFPKSAFKYVQARCWN
jgi:hypothetical protein